MFRPLSLLTVLVLLTSLAGANTGLQFLTFSQLPRGTALGEAFTGAAGDLTSATFNPAGLAKINKIQFALMHKSWFQDIYLNQGSVAIPLNKNVFSLGLTLNTVPDIPIRTGASSEPLGQTNAEDAAFSLGWSRSIQNLDWGLAAKLLYEKIHLNSTTGWAADVGVQYQYRDFRFGAAVLNWGPKLSLDQEDFSLPTQLRAGISYLLPEKLAQGKWTLLVDMVKPRDFDSYVNLGMEYVYQERYSARLGYRGGEANQSDISFGLGIKYNRYAIDYAYLPFKSDLGSSHQIALILEL